jgi:hypothetical protein
MVVKNRVLLITISVIVSLLVSCDDEKFPYDESGFTYRGQFLFDQQFLMDGFFASYSQDGYYKVQYFYEDGICFFTGFGSIDFSICPTIFDRGREVPYLWGYYTVHNDTLKMQTLDAKSRVKYCEFKVQEHWALIEDDRTLRFFKRINTEKSESIYDEVYRFYECPDKPDSTNILQNF